MLKLKRVELQGFKSFCDRSEMKFHGSGIAAVVGPNGCGKSNLSDAISWVLGEQSAKSLRGAHMSDVIFAGTKDRKPLGMASVTLTLVDPAAHEVSAIIHAHADGDGANGNGADKSIVERKPQEITITRRLYRSGDSEYLINGRTARLRDIQDLFMGTGLGPESYAIIEQGRIGQILSNKPQDRRSVIEEAAGITRFKTKRRLAEAKLEGAKGNLTRVFDILEEVTRQVNSLKRQAAKAKRYHELRSEMVEQLQIALTGRFRILERDGARIALDLNRANAAFQTLSTQLAEQEQSHAQLQESCFSTEHELTEARKSLSEKRLDAERTRSKLEYQTRQVTQLEQRITQGEAEQQQSAARLESLQQEAANHSRDLAEWDEQTEVARARLNAKEQERHRHQNTLREQERAAEAARQAALRLLGEANSLKNQLAQVEEFLSSMDRDTGRSQREEEAANADLARLNKTRQELSDKLNDRQLALQSTSEQRRIIEEELNVCRSRIQETRRQLDNLKGEVSRQRARRDSLDEIISHRSYTTDSVKRLFTAIEKGRAQDLRPLGVLADFVEVETQYEKAAEEFLHDELEYVVVESWEQAGAGITLMRQDLEGRATFFVKPPAEETPTLEFVAPDLRKEDGVIAKLTDVLKVSDQLAAHAATLLPRLAFCYLVADRAAAEQLAPRYPDLFFLLPDGICYQGHAASGGKKKGSGPLALKRELRELTGQLETKQKELDKTNRSFEQLESQSHLLGEEREQLRGQQQAQERDTAALNVEMRKLGEELSRVNSRLSVARMELERLRQQRERSEQLRDRNRQLLEEKESQRLAQESAMQGAREQIEQLQTMVAQLAEEHASSRVELAALEERRRSERAAQAKIETQIRELTQRRQHLANELERWSAERVRLQASNEELTDRASVLTEEIQALDQAVRRLAEQETVFRAQLAKVDEALKRTRTEWQSAQESRQALEVELVKAQSALQYLQETCRKELNTTLEELAAGHEVIPAEEELAQAEQRYQELRGKIDSLGPVNPQALEEHQEAQQRYDFLSAQRQDLIDSIRDTEKAIKDIDTETRRRFSEAFEIINNHFREMFRTLFGGGIGEMRLTDTENVIESGIDIVASPPNKRLQSVLLLSGGEKALTAMALLMAIFRYQPSPFCILDEVDAPLDEPNTERLNRLLKEMATHTQFVVITHSKRTMESAEVLYGVTMQEPGVSKLVSVKFQPLQQPAVLPPAVTEPAASAPPA